LNARTTKKSMDV